MKKYLVTIRVLTDAPDETVAAVQAAVGQEQVATWAQGVVAGTITPNEWMEGGPEVQVLGLWRSYTTLGSVEVPCDIVEVLVGQYRLRLVGEADEDGWHNWYLPESVEVVFAACPECDAELATELLEGLAQQVYDEFTYQPTGAPKPEPSLEKITGAGQTRTRRRNEVIAEEEKR